MIKQIFAYHWQKCKKSFNSCAGTFPIKDVSMENNMAAACMTYCNAAADCGGIFIKVTFTNKNCQDE
jgi:hypothetical protein